MSEVMMSSFYYDGHYQKVTKKIQDYINSAPDFISIQTEGSTRAAGDAIESLISKKFNIYLEDWCQEYSSSFERRAMADIAFTDKEGFYSIVDVKTHRVDTTFNRPNLTSVNRLARFYESDKNVFTLLMVKYEIEKTSIKVREVVFSPIEYFDWSCLTIGALGWGQIQLINSNVTIQVPPMSVFFKQHKG